MFPLPLKTLQRRAPIWHPDVRILEPSISCLILKLDETERGKRG